MSTISIIGSGCMGAAIAGDNAQPETRISAFIDSLGLRPMDPGQLLMGEITFPEPPEFVTQGDQVRVVGFRRGRVNTRIGRSRPIFVFALTVQNGMLTNIPEYVDTHPLARASETACLVRPCPLW